MVVSVVRMFLIRQKRQIRQIQLYGNKAIELILSPTTDTTRNVSQNALRSAAVTAAEATDSTNTTIWKPKILNCCMSCIEFCLRCRELVSHDRYDRYKYMETRL